MRQRTTVLLTSLGFALLLALTGSAAAQRLEISTRDIRATYPDLRILTGRIGEGPAATCPVTLEGSFHSRTFSKLAELLVGYVTRAIINRTACTLLSEVTSIIFLNGLDGNPNSLPWHIRYESFSGTLPRLTAINLRIISLSFLIGVPMGGTCLFRSTVADPARVSANVNTSSGQVTSLRFDLNARIPRNAGSEMLCKTEAHLSGDSTVSVLNSTALVFVRLI